MQLVEGKLAERLDEQDDHSDGCACDGHGDDLKLSVGCHLRPVEEHRRCGEQYQAVHPDGMEQEEISAVCRATKHEADEHSQITAAATSFGCPMRRIGNVFAANCCACSPAAWSFSVRIGPGVPTR